MCSGVLGCWSHTFNEGAGYSKPTWPCVLCLISQIHLDCLREGWWDRLPLGCLVCLSTYLSSVLPACVASSAMRGCCLPPAAPGANGDVVCSLPTGSFVDYGCTLTAPQMTALASGRIYFNVHTSANPSGGWRRRVACFAPGWACRTQQPRPVQCLSAFLHTRTRTHALPHAPCVS